MYRNKIIKYTVLYLHVVTPTAVDQLSVGAIVAGVLVIILFVVLVVVVVAICYKGVYQVSL